MRRGVLILMVVGIVMIAPCAWAQKAKEEPQSEEPKWMETEKAEDPAVEAVLETNPSTPAELVRAAKVLSDLKRPELAKKYLDRVLKANLNEAKLAELGEELGDVVLPEMATRRDLHPQSAQLADAVLKAVDRKVKDPERLAALVRRLGDPSGDVQDQALRELRRAGVAAAQPLLDALADPTRSAQHANVRAALVELDSDATGPLLGALEADNPLLVAQVIEVLAAADARGESVFLLGPLASTTSAPEVRKAAAVALVKLTGQAPSAAQAAGLLAEQARRYFDGRQTIRTDADSNAVLWTWDPGQKRCVARTHSQAQASLALAARLAREAYAVAPADESIRRIYLATMFEQAAYERGLDKPLDPKADCLKKAEEFGMGTVEAALSDALATHHVPAATVAAEILGLRGQANALLRRGSEPSPLVRASQQPDRRLRLAAVEAILRLRPTEDFVGAGTLVDTLGYFAASSGARRALVAGPKTEWFQAVVGFLTKMGYTVDTGVTGQDVLKLATASPDYEVAMIDAAVGNPSMDTLLQQIRRDARTGSLPVGIMAREGYLPEARRVARHDSLCEAFSRPHTPEAAEWQLQRLLHRAGPGLVSHAERMRQAGEALDRLAELAASPEGRKLFDVSRAEPAVLTAFYSPELSAKAIAVLRNLPTPQSQKALVDLASRAGQPLAIRQAAAEAFGHSVLEYGILLKSSEIQLQYDRYNGSKTADRATQQVLGAILDALEAPTRSNNKSVESDKSTPPSPPTPLPDHSVVPGGRGELRSSR